MFNKDLLEKHIAIDPRIQHGKPCIKGTRTPIHVVLEVLATGMDLDRVKKEFSPLSDDDIQACIWYAAVLTNEYEVFSQPRA